jgi:flagellin
MSFRINTNTSAMASQRAMNTVNRETEESFSKLASGLRITKAADDAAGMAISEKMKAEIRSSKQANRNANDAIGLVQVAEGGLTESTSILNRMRELAMQAATDTVSDSERGMSNLEYQGLKSELERIAQVTEFNGKKILNGQSQQMDFQVGVGEDSDDDRISFNTSSFNATGSALGVAHLTILSKGSAQASLSSIDQAFDRIASQRSLLGSIQNRLQSGANNLGIYITNTSHANSRIRDLDYADEAAKQARNSIVGQAGTAVMAQANTTGSVALKLI